jgi:tetratricopeptide (TPR) repeat protein
MKSRLLFLLLFCGWLSFGQNETLFEQGNNQYRDGNYEAAISTWERILDEGEHSAALYFNLGNAYYKIENLAESIYFYEKALQLAPRDAEIRNNLAIAQNSTVDIIEPLPKNLFNTWLTNTSQMYSYDGWAIAAVIFTVLFSLLFILYYFAGASSRKRIFFTGSMVALFIGLLSVFFAFKNYDLVVDQRAGIVFAASTQVRSEPVMRSEVSFTLHEGTKVKIISEVDGWKRIKLADGKEGWMLKDDLKEL